MPANETTLTPQAAPLTTGALQKLSVSQFSFQSPAKGLMYAYASNTTTQYNLGHYCGYTLGPIAFMVYAYDGADFAPAGMKLVVAAWARSNPAASILMVCPVGVKISVFRANLVSQGYTLEENTGYIYAESMPSQDTAPLHWLTVSGQQLFNNFYTTNQALITQMKLQGWQDHGVVGHSMPVYGATCAYSAATGKLELTATIDNDPDKDGSFYVGEGAGNLIEITRVGTDFSLTGFATVPADPTVFDIVSATAGTLTIRDNNSGEDTIEYAYTIYGRLTDGTTVQSDPKIINRSGAQS